MPNDVLFASSDRIVRPAILTDRSVDIFRFLHDAMLSGHQCALITLVEIIDGASRALGTHMAVLDDGRYCGFVSGGCIEAAVAREALLAISERTDRICRLGKGSPYFDIVLPCGGGIRLVIHVLKQASVIGDILQAFADRRIVSLVYNAADQSILVGEDRPLQTGWQGDRFIAMYRPDPRILVTGRGVESQAFASVASGVGLEIIQVETDMVGSLADEETAIVLLHHDIETELPLLRSALRTDAFYIGCLGSRRTHRRRLEILQYEGFSSEELDRIHAPIGLFGPAREARSVAVSVLAEILSAVEHRRR